MKKAALISILALYITGCDSSPEKKNVSELKNNEIMDMCHLENNDVTSGLKLKAKRDIKNPLLLNPMNTSQKSPALSAFEYSDYKTMEEFSAKDFIDDLGKANTVSVTNQNGSADIPSNSLICKGLITYTPSFAYGLEIKIPYEYSIKRNEGVLTKDISNGRNITFDTRFNDENLYTETTPTKNQEECISSYLNKLSKKISEMKSTPKSKYLPISSGDLVYLYFANSNREFTDDEIMSVFSRKWNSTNDTFIKDDIKKEEINGIKEKINSYKGIANVAVAANSTRLSGIIPLPNGIDGNPQLNNFTNASDSYIVDNPYDKELHGFKSDSAGCNRFNTFEYNNQGIVLDPRLDLRKCILVVNDDDARNISSKLTSLQKEKINISSTANHYLHIDGYLNQGNYIVATIVKSDFSIYKDVPGKSPELVFTGDLNWESKWNVAHIYATFPIT